MRKILTASTALLTAVGLELGMSTAASAADLSGRWKSASLKMDGVGYKMTVAAADSPANAYNVVLRFRYEDGTRGPRIKARMIDNGGTLYLLLDGQGSIENLINPNIMRGSLGNDGSMFFPTCYQQLKFITKKNADAGCLFQEMPS